MSSFNLKHLLAPGSVAVVGASDRPGSVGATVMRNLLSAGFRGPIWPVNLRRDSVAGVRAYRSPAQLPAAPDLAVICTPAPAIATLVTELGARGTCAAVVLGAGLELPAEGEGTLGQKMLLEARRCGLRLTRTV
jgi:acetyltransferase